MELNLTALIIFTLLPHKDPYALSKGRTNWKCETVKAAFRISLHMEAMTIKQLVYGDGRERNVWENP